MSKSRVRPKALVRWNEQTDKLKKKFVMLTDSDLYFEEGKMFSKLQKRLSQHSLEFTR